MIKANPNLVLDEYPIEKFTNAEYYYIISGLLGLGEPGFTREWLYLSFDQNELGVVRDVKFFFLTQTSIYEDEGEKDVVQFYLGRIDRVFDNLEIYKWQHDKEIAPPISLFRPALVDCKPPSIFRPVSFLKGVNRILSEGKFDERANNDLFDFKLHVNVPYGVRYQHDFGEFGPLRTNFSGNYFLVVEPRSNKLGGVFVNSFNIEIQRSQGLLTLDGEVVNLSKQVVDAASVQSYENGESNTVFIQMPQLKNEKYERHKTRMLPVLTETVLSLLTDMTPTTRGKVLEDDTPEELIVFCKEKYDREFDLHVDDLGIAGAHEVAWLEALAIITEDYWRTESKNPEDELEG